MSYLPIVAIFGVGIAANILMRQTKSRALKMMIGMPAIVLMVVLLARWM